MLGKLLDMQLGLMFELSQQIIELKYNFEKQYLDFKLKRSSSYY